MKRLVILMMCLALIPIGAGAETAYELPVDLVPGYQPNPACFTSNGYHDDSLDVRMEQVVYNNVTVNLAWIEVKSPTQLRTAIAGLSGDMDNEARPGPIVHSNHAVVAINGDFFTRRNGMIYREGVAIKQTQSDNKDALFIDENGDFHILRDSKPADMVAYLQAGHKMINTFSFGPGMVIDGEVQNIRDDYWFEPEGCCQRTVVCQVGHLKYLFVEVVGRTLKSRGFTMQQTADYLGTLGCVQQAYNLDGGQSTFMFFGRLYYDLKFHGAGENRTISDIIYVASAVDPATWKK